MSQVEKGKDSVHKTFLLEISLHHSKTEYSHMENSYETVVDQQF